MLLTPKIIAGSIAAVAVIGGVVLADTSGPSTPSPSPSDSPPVVLSPDPSATPVATPQNTPNPSPTMSSVQNELDNHEARITTLENKTPAPSTAPTSVPTIVNTYRCWVVSNTGYVTYTATTMSDGSTQSGLTILTGSAPTDLSQCPKNLPPAN